MVDIVFIFQLWRVIIIQQFHNVNLKCPSVWQMQYLLYKIKYNIQNDPFFLNIIHCKGIIEQLKKIKERLSPRNNYLNYCWFSNPLPHDYDISKCHWFGIILFFCNDYNYLSLFYRVFSTKYFTKLFFFVGVVWRNNILVFLNGLKILWRKDLLSLNPFYVGTLHTVSYLSK